jgi:ABC-2 type transport system permease protein
MVKLKAHSRYSGIFFLVIVFMIIVVANILGSYFFTRFDLTSEKRYSLSPATLKLLKSSDDVYFFRIYLEGDFPGGYKRLRDELQIMLDEFRAYAGDNIQYRFINPNEEKDPAKKKELYMQLIKDGLQPSNITQQIGDGEKQQIVFPGAFVSYKGRTLALNLLKNRFGSAPEEMLNNSIENLEYEISFILHKLKSGFAEKVGFLEGHGELSALQVQDFENALKESYATERVRIGGKLEALKDFQALVIAKPDSAFSEKDKFVIDQFIMRGGKVLWLIDPVFASMDSLSSSTETMGIAMDLNLEDMLFRYGVRLNTNLVMDIQAAPIPVVTGYTGNQPRQTLLPWFYFPLASAYSEHPVVKNLDAVRLELCSGIDTVGARGIRKTILLSSGRYTRIQNTPAKIDLRMVRKKPMPEEFNQSYEPLAVLLEGNFESVFKNRIPPQISESPEIAFKDKSNRGAMIVVSDGDVIKNQIQKSSGRVYPLGYDRYSQQTFGNKNFLLNCMNYLLDEEGLLELRTREVKLRLLDKTRSAEERSYWQVFNSVIPVLLVVILGLVTGSIRKRKFAKQA